MKYQSQTVYKKCNMCKMNAEKNAILRKLMHKLNKLHNLRKRNYIRGSSHVQTPYITKKLVNNILYRIINPYIYKNLSKMCKMCSLTVSIKLMHKISAKVLHGECSLLFN